MTGAEAEARAERIAAAYGQAPLAVLIPTVNALIMAAVLLADGAGLPVLLWFGLVVLVGLARLALRAAWRRDRDAAAHAARWGLASAAAAAGSGLLWGGGAALLWPQAPLLQLLWVFVLGGMCAGATALHYAHLPTALAFGDRLWRAAGDRRLGPAAAVEAVRPGGAGRGDGRALAGARDPLTGDRPFVAGAAGRREEGRGARNIRPASRKCALRIGGPT